MSNLFKTERQVGVDNMDVTYAPDGLTLSGHFQAKPGKEGAAFARELAGILLEAAKELEEMDPQSEEPPEKVDPRFGRAFD